MMHVGDQTGGQFGLGSATSVATEIDSSSQHELAAEIPLCFGRCVASDTLELNKVLVSVSDKV